MLPPGLANQKLAVSQTDCPELSRPQILVHSLSKIVSYIVTPKKILHQTESKCYNIRKNADTLLLLHSWTKFSLVLLVFTSKREDIKLVVMKSIINKN